MKLKALLLSLSVASTLFASSVVVNDPYARATPPNLPNSAAFMKLENTSSKDISLVSAKSNIAQKVELHTHDMKNGVMKMYQVPKIDIKANSTTVLKPGGFHVMFLGLKQKPLKEGQKVDLELEFSNGQKVQLSLPVKKVMAGMKMHHHGHNMKHH